jgi:hypothetical protein
MTDPDWVFVNAYMIAGKGGEQIRLIPDPSVISPDTFLFSEDRRDPGFSLDPSTNQGFANFLGGLGADLAFVRVTVREKSSPPSDPVLETYDVLLKASVTAIGPL